MAKRISIHGGGNSNNKGKPLTPELIRLKWLQHRSRLIMSEAALMLQSQGSVSPVFFLICDTSANPLSALVVDIQDKGETLETMSLTVNRMSDCYMVIPDFSTTMRQFASFQGARDMSIRCKCSCLTSVSESYSIKADQVELKEKALSYASGDPEGLKRILIEGGAQEVVSILFEYVDECNEDGVPTKVSFFEGMALIKVNEAGRRFLDLPEFNLKKVEKPILSNSFYGRLLANS